MKWSVLMETKREELEKSIREQYSKSINGNTGLDYAVLLYNDGDIIKTHRGQNSQSESEFNGKAICVYSQQGFYLEYDTEQEVDNDKDVQSKLVAKYNEMYPNETIEYWKEIDSLHDFIYENFQEWLNDVIDTCKDYEVSEFDACDTLDRKIKEEKTCELY